MADPRHPTDMLHDALDGRLDADRQAALDEHLAACEPCRRELQALQWTRAQVARAVRASEVPRDLDARLRAALDEEDSRARRSPSRGVAAGSRSRSWVRWIAAAAAIAAVIWVGSRLRTTDPPRQAAADLRAFIADRLPMDVQTADPPTLESRLSNAGLRFPARVFDLAMMDYRLAGGGVHRIAGQPSALFAYRGRGDRALVCQMYEGRVTDLPPPDDRRTSNGIEFFVYREGDVTAVFWQEGAVVCVLAANGDPEAVIRLAVAKAVRV